MIRQTETQTRASERYRPDADLLVYRALDLALDLARPTVLDRR